MRSAATLAIWILSLGYLLIGGTLATLFVMMPVSLDLGEMLAAGAEPWREAAISAGAFTLLAVAVALSLWCWHRGRARFAWLLASGEAIAVAWCGWVVYRDFF